MSCPWANDSAVVELLAQEIRILGSLEPLRSFCQHSKFLCDDDVLEQADAYFRKRTTAAEKLKDASPELQVFLLSTLVGEALARLYRDFHFQSNIDFQKICDAFGANNLLGDTQAALEVSEWADEDRTFTLGKSDAPVFKHPEIQSAVEDWAAASQNDTVEHALRLICGWSRHEDEHHILSRWEMIHLSCRFAHFLSVSTCDVIEKEEFSAPKERADFRNIISAVVGNWAWIEKSALEPAAMRFLRRIVRDLRMYTRTLMWEISENWEDLNEDARNIFVMTCAEVDANGHIKAAPNPENVMCFLAASFSSLSSIQDSATTGSEHSITCLDVLQSLVSALYKQLDKPSYVSRVGDRLFNDHASRPTGRDILTALLQLGLNSGGASKNARLVKEIELQLAGATSNRQ